MRRSRLTATIRHSLLLEPEELKVCLAVIRRDLESVNISAHCKDGTTLESDNIEEILDFDNPAFRRIERMTISARSKYPKTDSASLDIDSDSFSTATLSIDSTDDAQALSKKNEIVNRLKESKPGYDLLARVSVLTFIGCLGVIASFVGGALVFFGKVKTQGPRSFAEEFDFFVFTGAIFLAITYLLDKPRAWLFPRLHFLIGRQAQDAAERKKWRGILFNVLLVGLVVGILASLIAGIILHKWQT